MTAGELVTLVKDAHTLRRQIQGNHLTNALTAMTTVVEILEAAAGAELLKRVCGADGE